MKKFIFLLLGLVGTTAFVTGCASHHEASTSTGVSTSATYSK